jgi:hypothetical protein
MSAKAPRAHTVGASTREYAMMPPTALPDVANCAAEYEIDLRALLVREPRSKLGARELLVGAGGNDGAALGGSLAGRAEVQQQATRQARSGGVAPLTLTRLPRCVTLQGARRGRTGSDGPDSPSR